MNGKAFVHAYPELQLSEMQDAHGTGGSGADK